MVGGGDRASEVAHCHRPTRFLSAAWLLLRTAERLGIFADRSVLVGPSQNDAAAALAGRGAQTILRFLPPTVSSSDYVAAVARQPAQPGEAR
jgi:hypothetical protein